MFHWRQIQHLKPVIALKEWNVYNAVDPSLILAQRRRRWASVQHWVNASCLLWPNAGVMLAHRLRCWPNLSPTLGQCLVLAGIVLRWEDANMEWGEGKDASAGDRWGGGGREGSSTRQTRRLVRGSILDSPPTEIQTKRETEIASQMTSFSACFQKQPTHSYFRPFSPIYKRATAKYKLCPLHKWD